MENSNLVKVCKICKETQSYPNVGSFNRAKRNDSICRKCVRKNRCEVLLEETAISYYWIGFIMADGSISNSGRLSVGISIEDLDHLIKLQKFLGAPEIKKYGEMCRLTAMSVEHMRRLSEKFLIKSSKTYDPCDISGIKNEELLFSLSIGFIDGDGSFSKQYRRKDCFLRIQNHRSWLDNLIYMYGNSKINKRGYALTTISDHRVLKDMKKRALDLGLPILERKWNKIDLNYINRNEIKDSNLLVIKELIKNSIPRKEICNILGITKSGLSLILKRNNLKYENKNIVGGKP